MVFYLILLPLCKGFTREVHSGTIKKNQTSQTLRHPLDILDRHSIKFSKNKINSKNIKSHQCSLEKSHAVLIEYWFNTEFLPRLSSSQTKADSQVYGRSSSPNEPIHLNPYTKLDFSSNNPCFYCIPSKNTSDNYNKKPL